MNEVEMGLPIEEGQQVPDVDWPIRSNGEWETLNSTEEFAGKRVILFGLPGAFTPTCSTQQLPSFEANFKKFQALKIDDIYCLSVNDTFTMNAWFKELGIVNVKPIPDGNGEFTHKFGAEVKKSNLGFGYRSWRYAVVINDGKVEQLFAEEGFTDNAESDPYEFSKPEYIMQHLAYAGVA